MLLSNDHHSDSYVSSCITQTGNIRSIYYGFPTTTDSEGYNEGFCRPQHYAAPTRTSVPDAFWGICQLSHRSSTGKFLFYRVEPPSDSLRDALVSWHFFLSGVPMWLPWSPMGAQPLESVTLKFSWIYPWQAYDPPVDGSWLMQGVHWVDAHLTALSRGISMLPSQLSPSHSIHMVVHTAFGAWEESPNFLPSLDGREGLLSKYGSTWWYCQLQISGGHYPWWFWCGNQFIRLMYLLTPVMHSFWGVFSSELGTTQLLCSECSRLKRLQEQKIEAPAELTIYMFINLILDYIQNYLHIYT